MEEITNEEQTSTETPQTTPEETLPDIVAEIRAEHARQITELKTKHANEIKARDDIIKQMITAPITEKRETIADKLNQKRQFKKW